MAGLRCPGSASVAALPKGPAGVGPGIVGSPQGAEFTQRPSPTRAGLASGAPGDASASALRGAQQHDVSRQLPHLQ